MAFIFTEEQTNQIIDLYVNGKFSLSQIGEIIGVSKTPISRILKEKNLIKKGNSNGLKIILTLEQEIEIKELYLFKYKNSYEIGETMNLTSSFIDKYLNSVDYRRTKNSAASIGLVKRYSGMNYDEYLLKLPEYVKYRKKVLSITNKQNISSLENYNKRGTYKNDDSYHLDHKFSIIEGFKNNIEPEIIGNINNLEFIPWKENLKKRTKCSITINQLKNI